MSFSIVQGRNGTFQCSDPKPRISIRRTDVDAREDTWFSDRFPNPLLSEGAAHPSFPGLILESADFEETSPPWPAVPGTEGVLGDYRVSCSWRGNCQSSAKQGATKIINRGSRRTLDSGFDERTVRTITWYADPFSITGSASTDVITTDQPHGFVDGRPVTFPEMTGGTGITACTVMHSSTLYFTLNCTPFTFQISTTIGGSAVDFTTDITAGKVCAAEFNLGSPHPSFPNMYAVDIGKNDDYTDWKTCDVTYRGLETAKPYKRTINGSVTTSNSKFDGYTYLNATIWENYPPADSGTTATLSGTDLNVEYDASTVAITDNIVWVGDPPTDKIGHFWTPADAPDVAYFTLYGVGYKYFFPFGWKCIAMPCEQIPGTNVWLISPTFTYQVVFMPIPPA